MSVQLYTDGACCPNPGQGAWAYLLFDPANHWPVERSGAVLFETTNNRMELLAAIKGLSHLRLRTDVELFTDSAYVGEGLTLWLPKWKQNTWRMGKRGNGTPVRNDDLWRRLDALCSHHSVTYHKVAAHSGHPQNERVNRLAELAARTAAQTMGKRVT